MFFKRIFTKGIAHYSYIIGDGGSAIVIDPQSDIDKYLEVTRSEGLKIEAILETHRNEDFLVGSKALSDLTGAGVFIAAEEDLDYKYGQRISDGEEVRVGNLVLEAIHTPGHTKGHMSYLLKIKDTPYMVFSGDALFFGGVGRTDFYGNEELDNMTGMLYDSIFKRLLPLGEHLILCPAHGAGSACGASIDERPLSTLGYEQRHNAFLQYDSREEFVKNVGEMLHKPDYFTVMERGNLTGNAPIDCNPFIRVLHPKDIDNDKDTIVDIRNQRAFLSEHIENSLYIERGGLLSFINWFIPTDKSITFVTDNNDSDYLNNLYMDMRRIGYDGDLSFLANGMKDWNTLGLDIASTKFTLPNELRNVLGDKDSVILDIREESEFKDTTPIEGSKLIPLQEIRDRVSEISKDKSIYIVCASGIRSTTVSSFLNSQGFDTSILLGGMKAWKNLE